MTVKVIGGFAIFVLSLSAFAMRNELGIGSTEDQACHQAIISSGYWGREAEAECDMISFDGDTASVIVVNKKGYGDKYACGLYLASSGIYENIGCLKI